MKKILLTSAGFENKRIEEEFMELIDKEARDIKALFITTAAVEPDAIMVLPKCLEDLLNCGILKENITVYDMHKLIEFEEIKKYDVIYVCGGNTTYLVNRIREVGFKNRVNAFIQNGGIYIGVSAGSVAASGEYENGLDFIKNKLGVHFDKGTESGVVRNEGPIYLTDNQAVLITDEVIKIIE